MKTITVSEYRDAIERLERVFNIDRHACVGDQEKGRWRDRCERALTELRNLECVRAKPADIYRASGLIVKVDSYLNADTEVRT